MPAVKMPVNGDSEPTVQLKQRVNGSHERDGGLFQSRADETQELLHAVEKLLIPFIANAEKDRSQDATELEEAMIKSEVRGLEDSGYEGSAPDSPRDSVASVDSLAVHAIEDPVSPHKLIKRLGFELPEKGQGMDGLLEVLEKILDHSVNTWNQGFMHKLYATTNPIGVISELVLAVLNTALHVYKVSPALSVVERLTAQRFASCFGLNGPHAGGGTHPGGSASNMAALVIARNTYFPDIRHTGNGNHKLVVFTSENCHYSIKKAAQTLGLGAEQVWAVPTDEQGRMSVPDLERLLADALQQNYEPFFINATAGTTVLGAVDPLHQIADICEREDIWMHVDASWGGGAILSDKHKHKLSGIERARSITTNPHKMLGVPVTCSFLLAADMREFWRANRIDASYLFHDSNTDGTDEVSWDLADATLQCGRKGDSLKLALSWIYQGREGLGAYVENGFDNSEFLASLVQDHPQMVLASTFPPPCLQVCFYHQPDGSEDVSKMGETAVTTRTTAICDRLMSRGFMIDHAPGKYGHFIRVVVNGETTRATVIRLMNAVEAAAREYDFSLATTSALTEQRDFAAKEQKVKWKGEVAATAPAPLARTPSRGTNFNAMENAIVMEAQAAK